MISSSVLYDSILREGTTFFSGVPDSLLKDFCAYVTDNSSDTDHIITANEGAAVALAAGHFLATGNIGVVYLQNSGFGNVINPLLSLIDREVYNIPVLFLIGWRGEPGTKDEPQHVQQGKRTIPLLDALELQYSIVDKHTSDIDSVICNSYSVMRMSNRPFALVVREGTFEPYILKKKLKTQYEMNREQSLQIVIDHLGEDDVVVSTTGKTSREVFEYREAKKQGHEKDFLTVGSMGHASQIALGIALHKPVRRVFCLDGDGAALMHLGSLAINGKSGAKNFRHIVVNNGAHDSVGGQPTVGFQIDFAKMASAAGYAFVRSVETRQALEEVWTMFAESEGPSFLEIKVNKGARNELGRPTTTPRENKNQFMKFLSR